MVKLSKEYVAGLLDGEGYIAAVKARGKPYLFVNIVNTHKPVLEKLKAQYGGSLRQNGNKPPRLACFQWTVCSNTARGFLKELLPFLLIKKEQAALAIRLQNRIAKKQHNKWHPISKHEADARENLFLQIKKLKRREYK